MRIELFCKACGQNRFAFPEHEGDDGLVTCLDCGHEVGSLGALKDEVARAVMRKSPLPEDGKDHV